MNNLGPRNPWLDGDSDFSPTIYDDGAHDGGAANNGNRANNGGGNRDSGNAGGNRGDCDSGSPATDAPLAAGAAQGSGGGTTGTTLGSALPAVPASPTAFTININWDTSVTTAPSGFVNDILAAVKYLETQFTDAMTMTINVGYGEVGGNALGSGALGSSLTSLTTVPYANLLAAVKSDAKTATDTGVVASLPAANPIAGSTFWATTAQAKALGLAPANGAAVDGSVGFGLSSVFTYGATNTSGTIAAGTYDFFATAVHEITEVMGRQLLTGATEGTTAKSYDLLDLLHFSSADTHDYSATAPGYFSVNNGVTNLGAFNTTAPGDAGDWASSATPNSFDAFAKSGVLTPVSPNDLTVMDAIGWNASGGGGGSTSTSQPTGVSVTAATASLNAAQGSTGLAAKAALATFNQIGGLATDTYTNCPRP